MKEDIKDRLHAFVGYSIAGHHQRIHDDEEPTSHVQSADGGEKRRNVNKS